MIFTKMSGAGNDFIVVDNTGGDLDGALQPDFVQELCRRCLGVGADGLLELLPPEGPEAFRMRYYNSDGGRASMCGNGARCICCFAMSRGLVEEGREFIFASDAGLHTGLAISEDTAKVWMTEPKVVFMNRRMDFGITEPVSLVNTGVPHAVVMRTTLEDGTFEKFAPLLRHHPLLGPEGANADWMEVRPDGSVGVRTFERGVEGETLACGTGAVAVAVALSESRGDFKLPVNLQVRSGLFLTVGRDEKGWWLSGQAKAVYRGFLIV
jgi:diaminopimelate epimerase